MKEQQTATWSAKQERLALLIASGYAIKAAAAECKMGERTAHTHLENPAFRAYIGDLRGRMVSQATGRLTLIATQAVKTLHELMSSQDENVKLRASIGALKLLFQAREHGELAERVAELEAAAEANGNGRHR